MVGWHTSKLRYHPPPKKNRRSLRNESMQFLEELEELYSFSSFIYFCFHIETKYLHILSFTKFHQWACSNKCEHDEGIILVIFIMKIAIYLTYVGHSLILTNDILLTTCHLIQGSLFPDGKGFLKPA